MCASVWFLRRLQVVLRGFSSHRPASITQVACTRRQLVPEYILLLVLFALVVAFMVSTTSDADAPPPFVGNVLELLGGNCLDRGALQLDVPQRCHRHLWATSPTFCVPTLPASRNRRVHGALVGKSSSKGS